MDQEQFEKQLQESWARLCRIHFLTKKYFILSEEFGNDLRTFLQPIKEQRDAYEHLTRAYYYMYVAPDKPPTDMDVGDYIVNNVNKAIGHEYRAFFDTADYLSIIVRKKITDCLAGYSFEQVVSVYESYIDVKKFLLDIRDEIATIREEKDIANFSMLEKAEEYGQKLEKLLRYQRIVELEIVPALASKYPKEF